MAIPGNSLYNHNEYSPGRKGLPEEFVCKNDTILRRVILYQFNIYLEDYSPFTIREAFDGWKESKIGTWCVDNAQDIAYQQNHDIMNDAYNILIFGYMEEKHYTWFLLNK